jgi:DNA-binding response OmpR family regulator
MPVLHDRHFILSARIGYIAVSCAGATVPEHEQQPSPKPGGDTSLLLPGHGELVLVVDDDDELRKALARMLASLGFSVLSAPTGEEGLVVAEGSTKPLDAILVDVVLPRLSGPDMVERLARRKIRPAVIYMTGYDDPASLHHVLNTPCETPLLHKPFTLHALVLVLRNLLDRRKGRKDP